MLVQLQSPEDVVICKKCFFFLFFELEAVCGSTKYITRLMDGVCVGGGCALVGHPKCYITTQTEEGWPLLVRI